MSQKSSRCVISFRSRASWSRNFCHFSTPKQTVASLETKLRRVQTKLDIKREMENDFINFKSKEVKENVAISSTQIAHMRSEPNLFALSQITGRKPALNIFPTNSNESSLQGVKSYERLKEFLFNPDLQGKGRNYEIGDAASYHDILYHEYRSSSNKVRFFDGRDRGANKRTANFSPNFNLNLVSGKGSIAPRQTKRFSIHQSRASMKNFIGALEALARQSQNRATNSLLSNKGVLK